MTLQEFLIEFTLRHGKVPCVGDLEFMQENGCFDKKSNTADVDKAENDSSTPLSDDGRRLYDRVWTGVALKLKKPLEVGIKMTLPAGFIVRCDNINLYDRGTSYEHVTITIKIFGDRSDGTKDRKTQRYELTQDQFDSQFELTYEDYSRYYDTLSPSGQVFCDGRVTFNHSYSFPGIE